MVKKEYGIIWDPDNTWLPGNVLHGRMGKITSSFGYNKIQLMTLEGDKWIGNSIMLPFLVDDPKVLLFENQTLGKLYKVLFL